MAESGSGLSCVVCCHEKDIWALGECNHPTCLLCCARLRILCDQKECPVCRLALKVVVVVSKVRPFNTFQYQNWRSIYRQYDLYFQSRDLFRGFWDILDYWCPVCPDLPSFKNFRKLREHVNKFHDLHYCEICVENLKLFPSEFKTYTRPKLNTHRREGDPDDSSYKGHPLCRFCDDRYLDKDALHMHLRKQHFWCHFCESDGKQDFYPDMRSLRSHFKADHYLCEEGDCYNDTLTSAFRNEIDLKAHRASTHSKGMSKADVKKMRQLPMDFFVNAFSEEDFPTGPSRRAASASNRGGGGGGNHSRSTRPDLRREREEREMAVAKSASLQAYEKGNKQTHKKPLNSGRKKLCAQENPEPPPGFEVLKKHDDEELKKEVLTEKGQSSERKEEVVRRYGEVADEEDLSEHELMSESWPSLALSLVPVPETSNNKPSFSEKVGTVTVVTAPAGSDKMKGESRLSPSPIPPPPGYSQAINPPSKKANIQPPDMVTAKPKHPFFTQDDAPMVSSSSKYESSQKNTLSSKAFPPLISVAEIKPSTTTTKASSVPKPSGGSKVFEEIRRVLDYDKDRFKEFQTLSGWFRSGQVSISEYDSKCVELFGPSWGEVGPQVAKVMPHGEKREELMTLFASRISSSVGWGKTGAKTGTEWQKSKKKKTKVKNAWMAGGGGGGGGGGRGVSEEDFPSLGIAVASKLPADEPVVLGESSASSRVGAVTASYSNSAWKVPIHS